MTMGMMLTAPNCNPIKNSVGISAPRWNLVAVPTKNANSEDKNPYTLMPTNTFLSSNFLIRRGVKAMDIIVPAAVEIPRMIIRFCPPRMAFAACTWIAIAPCLANPKK